LISRAAPLTLQWQDELLRTETFGNKLNSQLKDNWKSLEEFHLVWLQLRIDFCQTDDRRLLQKWGWDLVRLMMSTRCQPRLEHQGDDHAGAATNWRRAVAVLEPDPMAATLQPGECRFKIPPFSGCLSQNWFDSGHQSQRMLEIWRDSPVRQIKEVKGF